MIIFSFMQQHVITCFGAGLATISLIGVGAGAFINFAFGNMKLLFAILKDAGKISFISFILLFTVFF